MFDDKKITRLRELLSPKEIQNIKEDANPEQTPLWHYWDEFVTKYLRTGKSIHTVQGVRDTLRLIIRHTNIYNIDQCLNHTLIEDELHTLMKKRGFSTSTFNSYLKNLKTYFIWLERQDYISENKLKKIMTCSERRGKQHTSTEEEINLVQLWLMERRQTTLERKRNLLFFGILRFTGVRPVEIEKMKVGDIYATSSGYKLVIYGAKQNKDPRYYLLPCWLRDLYLDYLHYRNKLDRTEDAFFISSSKRTGWTRKGMKRLLIKATSELGFKITAYSVRRFVATKLHTEGVDIHKIADYLGHKRISTTLKYIEESCIRTADASMVMGSLDQQFNPNTL